MKIPLEQLLKRITMMTNNLNEEFIKAAAFQRLSPYMMKEKFNQMNGDKIAPDTIGVDYFFLDEGKSCC